MGDDKMTIKDIEQFQEDLANISNETINPFVQIYGMLKGLIISNWEAISQEFMNDLSQKCKDIKKLQIFLNRYIEFQNKLMLEFEVLETLDDDKFHNKIESIGDNIFSTVPDFVKKQNLFGAIEDIVLTIIEEYNINIQVTDNQQLEQNINKALDNNEMMVKVFKEFLGTYATYAQNQDKEYTIEQLIEFHRMLIVFIFVANLHRKQCLDNTSQAPAMANNTNYKVGRNELCPCGSGKKYKKCCLNKKPPVFIYQLKVAIKGAKPPIWRRVLVESDSSFEDLHDIIQRIFNWENCHIYQFDGNYGHYCDDEFIDEPYGYDDLKNYPSYKSKISDELKYEKDKISYTYDFGDNWKHTITLEKILPVDENVKYPICTAGRKNGPLEDCGGLWGYYSIVNAIENNDFSDVENLFDEDDNFYYEDFDPNFFDKDEINRRLGNYI
jgi:hypothetical protein